MVSGHVSIGTTCRRCAGQPKKQIIRIKNPDEEQLALSFCLRDLADLSALHLRHSRLGELLQSTIRHQSQPVIGYLRVLLLRCGKPLS